jgi:DNA-binding NtrC family response regulator
MKPAVLILDDDHPTLELYTRELSDEYMVFPCSSIPEAIPLLTQEHFAAIVFEPAMENGEGWDFLQKLAEFCIPRHIPIIFCSTQDEHRAEIPPAAGKFLVKPVLPNQLAQTLKQILHQSSPKSKEISA